MWVHPINIDRPEFGIFSHIHPDLLGDEEKFHGFFKKNIEQFYHLSQLGGEEIRKQNTSYSRVISPEELFAIFFEVRAIKICRTQERYTRYNWSYPFS
jgi:hypothetical protein